MKFSRSGWFDHYLKFRSDQPLQKTLPTHGIRLMEDTGVHNDTEQSIYSFLQPTGLLYGGLIDFPFPGDTYPKGKYFDSLDRVFIIFLDSLFASLVSDRHFLLDGLIDEEDRFRPAVEVAVGYFTGNGEMVRDQVIARLENRVPDSNGKKALKQFEKEITNRITSGSWLMRKPELFFNTFLFLDLYNCLQWQRKLVVEPEMAEESLRHFHRQQQQHRETLLKLVISATQSDGMMRRMEWEIIDHFLKTSGLPASTQQELKILKESPLPLDSIEIPEMPWIVRRYFIEIILLIVMIDQSLSEKEMDFVVRVAEKLELWEEEMYQSQAALDIFLMANQDKINFLKKRSNIITFKDRFLERGSLTIKKNLDGIVNEIHETQELYALLMKATKTKLTQEERAKVNDQLMDILKTIPALAIFALPGGGVILPVLIRLLPFNILPSSFED